MNSHKAYLVLMALELTTIGIKYGGSETNPFQQPSPTMLLFLAAVFCHVLSSTGNMTEQTSIITFHVSGIIGCETLLQILIAEFVWYCNINLLLLLLASLCFFNNVTQLLRRTPSNATQELNMEPQPQLEAQPAQD